ncbi:MAG: CHAT domain protein [Candidatus Argoarchaeum ethanivorans]|uniref:CHAT domain protein n=1 Tax=Candidatus Argoarchaeum ethanivorans TaxID=2608793 RepID=A0A811T4W0_9EURY|nr:MAG: CHAT domain protein [Candidatus Argoarchaeum ethanivorans]
MSGEMAREDFDRGILSLAERYPTPEEFLSVIESLDIPEGKSGGLFFQIGITLHKFSKFRMALAAWNQALTYYIKNEDLSGESDCYGNLGNAYNNLGDFKKAIEFYEKSLKIKREIGDLSGESKCYGNFGAAYRSLGDFKKAIEFHEKSLRIFKKIGDVSGESNCYGNLGAAYGSLGDFKKAIEFQKKSLRIKREIGDLSGESACYRNLGVIYGESDDLTMSLDALKRSIEIREKIKGEIDLEELRTSFHAQTVSTYDALANVYLRTGDTIESINTLEHSKTRELADFLFYAEILKGKPEFREIIQEKARLKHKVELNNKWKNAISEAEKISVDDSINRIKTEIERTDQEYAVVSSKLHHLYDEVAGLHPRDYDIVSNTLNTLKRERKWAVLEYLLLPHESEFIVFIINEKGEINPVRTKYDETRLDSQIKTYTDTVILSSKKDFRDKAEKRLRELSTDLYATLIPKDVKKALDDLKAEHLIIVPHKELHLVPWEILNDGEDYLGLKYSISRNFSLDLTSIAMNKQTNINDGNGFSALLMGNPTLDLNGSETEVNKIKEKLNEKLGNNPTTLTRDKATKENFIERIKTPLNIFHFSGHGTFQFPPGFSSLVFNNSSELTANELSGMRFKGSPIVSLSACETGITPPIKGEEMMGLVRGFIVAGSPSIVSTSWRVYDNSACHLMVEFYKNILENNCVGLSLKKARKTVFEEYNGEILHWGAYTMYGDPFKSIF